MCVCALASAPYLDHVKVTIIRENGVNLTVQLLEVAFNGINRQCVIGVFTEEMMTCKKQWNGLEMWQSGQN